MRVLHTSGAVCFFAALSVSNLQGQNRDDTVRGEWELDLRRRTARVNLYLETTSGRGSMQSGFTVDLDELRGLSRGDLEGSRRRGASFELRRDAGVVAFEGIVRDGEGRGEFVFTPDDGWRDYLADHGHPGVRDREVFSMALHGIDRSFISEMEDLGFDRLSTSRLLALGIHGASPEFVRQMREAGYDDLSVDELLQFRIHGVTPEFVAAMSDEGFDALTSSDLVQARIHGVTPRYAREMRELHGRRARFDELVQTRIHGVSPEFIAGMASFGLDIDIDDAVQFRIHGVTPSFVREVMGLDIGRVDGSDLVQMRIHGITVSFIDEVLDAYSDIDVDDLVDLKIHGDRWRNRRRNR